MQLMFDTDAGLISTVVHNYVEGGSNEIMVCLPACNDHRPHCIGEMFEQTLAYLQENMHLLYEVVDQIKGKAIREMVYEARLPLELCLAEALFRLPNDLEVTEYRDDLIGQMEIIDELLDMTKRVLKSSLKLVMVQIVPDQPTFFAHFSVPGLSLAPVVIGVAHTY